MDILLIGIFVLFLFSGYFIRRSKASKSLNLPPEASGAWPIIGHLHLMGGRDSNLPHLTLARLSEKLGPIFTIHLGMYRTLIVSSPQIAEEIFTTHDTIVTARSKTIFSKIIGYNHATFVSAPRGPYWREIRKIVATELCSNRRLEQLKHVREVEIMSTIKYFYKMWGNEKKVGANEKKDGANYEHTMLIDMKHWFNEMGLNIILRKIVGKKYFNYFNESENEYKAKKRCLKVIDEFLHYLEALMLRDVLPFIGWLNLDLGGHEKKMRRIAKDVDDLANEWLDENRKMKDFGEKNDSENDNFIYRILKLLNGSSLEGFDCDTVVKATSLALIGGGVGSAGVVCTWALSHLLNNPKVMKKAQQELETHVGKSRLVQESDINKLPYFQALVKEVLRLQPPGPLGGQREFLEDSTVHGYHIPKGTRLFVNLWKIHNDPQVWPDPDKFKPERFLDGRCKDVDVRGQHFELIPFGAGRRACPGISMGIQLVHLMLANFLHAFDISNADGELVDLSEIPGILNVKTTPLNVLIKPRLNSGAY